MFWWGRRSVDESSRGKLLGIQYLRGFAAALVALFHAFVQVGPEGAGLSNLSIGSFGDRGVDLFFVLSGFIILHAHMGQAGKIGLVLSYVAKRMVRIVPLTFIVATGWFAAMFLASKLRVSQVGVELTWEKYVSSALVFPMLSDPSPIVIWSLKHEFAFYTVFIAYFFRKEWGFALAAAWAAIALIVSYSGDNLFATMVFSNYNALFIMGMISCVLYDKAQGVVSFSPWLFLLGIAQFLMFSVWAVSKGGHEGIGSILVGLSASILVLTGALCRLGLSRLPKLLGDASFSIYLVHFPVIVVLDSVGLFAELSYIVRAVVYSCISIAVGFSCYFSVERPIIRWAAGAIR